MATRSSVRSAVIAGVSVLALVAVSACSSHSRLAANGGFGGGAGAGEQPGTGDGGTGGTGGGGAGGGGDGGIGGGGGGGGGTGGGGGSGGGGGGGSIVEVGSLGRVSDLTGETAGGALALVGNAPILGATPVGEKVASVGGALRQDGLGGLPAVGGVVDGLVATGDGVLNDAAKIGIGGQTVAGSSSAHSTQLVGASALGPQVDGTVLTAGLLNGAPAGGQPTQLVSLGLSDNQVLGSEGPALIGANLLSPNQPQGSLLSAGLLSGGGSGGSKPAEELLGGLTDATGQVLGGVTDTVGQVLGGATEGGLLGGLTDGRLLGGLGGGN